MKISVVTWDGGFRESFHTVDFFGQQDYPTDAYEFIWVEHGEVPDELAARIDTYPNARIIQTEHDGQYHVGRCINAGVRDSNSELIVVTDGDIAVRTDFLKKVADAHRDRDDQAIYFRRWDEPEEAHTGDLSIDYLEGACELYNATNYGGGTSFRRSLFDHIGGYEDHWVFGGPGSVNMEFYVRLRNSGAAIIWHPEIRLFHPWHPGTRPGDMTLRKKQQKWVIEKRELNISTVSNQKEVDRYLEQAPFSNSDDSSDDLTTRIVNRMRHYKRSALKVIR